MTGLEVTTFIRKQYPKLVLAVLGTPGNLIVMDSQYQPVSEKDFERKWYEVWIKQSWIPERQDCDELAFAEMLRVRKRVGGDKAAAVGVAGGIFQAIAENPHAVNVFVRSDGSIKLWDYQQQKFFYPRPEDIVRWLVI